MKKIAAMLLLVALLLPCAESFAAARWFAGSTLTAISTRDTGVVIYFNDSTSTARVFLIKENSATNRLLSSALTAMSAGKTVDVYKDATGVVTTININN